jgi:hypothetical protein
MGTRAIVTSHPDVACYVCGRRLLRGEHHEQFLVEGTPQPVCELCTPRAAQQGWQRGSEPLAPAEPLPGSRGGAGLLSRLRGATRTARAVSAGRSAAPAAPERDRHGADLLDASAGAPAQARIADTNAEPEPAASPLQAALQVFNASEYPRRNASLARSLGEPDVSVALDEDLGYVTIVVAWELCWYRYRVDTDELQPGVRMIAQGRTLDELQRSERLANAHADQLGELSLLAAAV